MCGKEVESIQHIIGGCSPLAPGEYLARHNVVCKVIHQGLCKNFQLVKDLKPTHKYIPAWKAENGDTVIYWDTPIITVTAVPHNRPDIVVIDRKDKHGWIIDIGVPI